MSRNEVIFKSESKYDKMRRESNLFLLGIIVRWALTLFSLGAIYVLITEGSNKGLIVTLFFLIVGSIYAWYVEYFLIKKHKRKYGRRWKWYKEPLFKEVIAIIILILIVLYLIS